MWSTIFIYRAILWNVVQYMFFFKTVNVKNWNCKLLLTLCNLISKLLKTFLALWHLSDGNVDLPNQISPEWGELFWRTTLWAWNCFYLFCQLKISVLSMWQISFYHILRSLRPTYNLSLRALSLAVAIALILKSKICMLIDQIIHFSNFLKELYPYTWFY